MLTLIWKIYHKKTAQIINGDLVVLSIYNQASASDSVTQLYRLIYIINFVIHTYNFSIKEDRIVLEIPEESSLIGASVSGDRRKMAFLYSGLVDPLMLVVLQASDYKEEVKVEKLLENCFENLFTFLKVLLSSKLKTGDASHK